MSFTPTLSNMITAVKSAVTSVAATQAELEQARLDTQNNASTYNKGEQGVFAEYPFSTPKYARNKGLRDNEFKDSLARFYISLAGGGANGRAAIKNYLKTIPREAQALAKVLVGSNTNNGGTGFIDFFLAQANETFNEAAQVEKVLADNYVAFFFGSEPPVFQYAGTLLNSVQDDQRMGMAIAYQHLIRGTQLARRGALLRLRYDDVIVSGAIMNMSQSLTAENEMAVPFNFTLLVKEYLIIRAPAKVTTKVGTAFALPQDLKDVGTASDIRSRTLASPSKLSSTSVAGDDQDASEEEQAAETPAAKLEAASNAGNLAATPQSDLWPITSLLDVAPPGIPYFIAKPTGQ